MFHAGGAYCQPRAIYKYWSAPRVLRVSFNSPRDATGHYPQIAVAHGGSVNVRFLDHDYRPTAFVMYHFHGLSGSGGQLGHYCAFVLRAGEWWMVDDGNVIKVEGSIQDAVRRQVSVRHRQLRVALYERVD